MSSLWNHWTIAAKVWWSASQWGLGIVKAGSGNWRKSLENWCQTFGWSMIRKFVHYTNPPQKKLRFFRGFLKQLFWGWKLIGWSCILQVDSLWCNLIRFNYFQAGKPNTRLKGLQISVAKSQNWRLSWMIGMWVLQKFRTFHFFGQRMPPCDRIATASLIRKRDTVKNRRKPVDPLTLHGQRTTFSTWYPRHPARSAKKNPCVFFRRRRRRMIYNTVMI